MIKAAIKLKELQFRRRVVEWVGKAFTKYQVGDRSWEAIHRKVKFFAKSKVGEPIWQMIHGKVEIIPESQVGERGGEDIIDWLVETEAKFEVY